METKLLFFHQVNNLIIRERKFLLYQLIIHYEIRENFIYFYHNTLMVMDCCLFMINTFLWKKLKFVVMNFEDKCERKKKGKIREKIN